MSYLGLINLEASVTEGITASSTDTFTNKTITSTTNDVAAGKLHSATTVIDVISATAPTSGQVLTATASTTATWQTPSVSGYTLIASQIKTDSLESSFDFTSLPSTYSSLRILFIGRSSIAATFDNLTFRFNNDSGANYDNEYVENYTTSVSGIQNLAGTSVGLGLVAGNNAPASLCGTGTIDVPFYKQTYFKKQFQYHTSLALGTATGSFWNFVGTGFWNNASAIDRITIYLPASNFMIGSSLYIYGIA